MKKVTVIGGGTGLAVILRGLKQIPQFALSAVVSVADDGGSSGTLREDLGMLPPGDVRSCILALADDEGELRDLLAYRFNEGRLAGQNLGNLMIAAADEIYGGFEKAVEKISSILKVKGRVIPVSGEKPVLCAELSNGNIVVGESYIPKVSQREEAVIRDIFFEDDITISRSAAQAVLGADAIVIGPGSLYTSIIPNMLASGMKDALAGSNGIVIYVANVMSQPGETHGMSLAGHFDTLSRYLGPVKVNAVLANNKILADQESEKYLHDGAEQLLATAEDRRYFADQGIELIENNFIETEMGYIRHDAGAVSACIEEIIMQPSDNSQE